MLLLLFLQISFYVKVGKFSIKIDFFQSLREAKKVIIIFGCCGSIDFPSPASNPFWTILRGNLEAFLVTKNFKCWDEFWCQSEEFKGKSLHWPQKWWQIILTVWSKWLDAETWPASPLFCWRLAVCLKNDLV